MRTVVVHARRRTPFGTVTVLRDKVNGSLRYSQGAVYQSVTDRHGVSLSAYVHAIYGLIVPTPARKILLIGGAGGTLGTMLARSRRQVTMVDINPESFHLARRFFGLPESVVCKVDDGLRFLRNTPARFDAIVFDVHDGTSLPDGFARATCFRLAARRLSSNGHIFLNLIVADDRDPALQRIAKALGRTGLVVQILDSPGLRGRNAILVAGATPLRKPPQLLVLPEIDSAELEDELRSMQWQD